MSSFTDVKEIDFDPRLKTPFSCLIVGPSGCGKSFFVKSVLHNCNHVMDVVPENIVWIYTSFQPLYAELQKMNKKIKFVEGLPHSFQDENLFPPDQNHLVIPSRSGENLHAVQTSQKYERYDVDSKCISSREIQPHH